jgi:hypothetical protein
VTRKIYTSSIYVRFFLPKISGRSSTCACVVSLLVYSNACPACTKDMFAHINKPSFKYQQTGSNRSPTRLSCDPSITFRWLTSWSSIQHTRFTRSKGTRTLFMCFLVLRLEISIFLPDMRPLHKAHRCSTCACVSLLLRQRIMNVEVYKIVFP